MKLFLTILFILFSFFQVFSQQKIDTFALRSNFKNGDYKRVAKLEYNWLLNRFFNSEAATKNLNQKKKFVWFKSISLESFAGGPGYFDPKSKKILLNPMKFLVGVIIHEGAHKASGSNKLMTKEMKNILEGSFTDSVFLRNDTSFFNQHYREKLDSSYSSARERFARVIQTEFWMDYYGIESADYGELTWQEYNELVDLLNYFLSRYRHISCKEDDFYSGVDLGQVCSGMYDLLFMTKGVVLRNGILVSNERHYENLKFCFQVTELK